MIPSGVIRCLFSPDRLSGSCSHFYAGYRGFLSSGQNGCIIYLTTHFRLLPRWRISGCIHTVACTGQR